MATTDPVLHALVDLVQAVSKIEHTSAKLAISYKRAVDVIREYTAPGGDRTSLDATSDEGGK
jgi:hypothetical protein